MQRSYMQLFDELEERVIVLKKKISLLPDGREKREAMEEVALVQQYLTALRHKLLGAPTGKYRRLETQEGDDDGKE